MFARVATRVAFAALLPFSLSFSLTADAQDLPPWNAEKAAAGRYIIDREAGGTSCRVASSDEAVRLQAPDRALLQRIDRGQGRVRANAGGLTINLNATARLNANPTVKAAFVRAAEIWEAILADPSTVSIKVDYGPDFFGQDSFGDLTLGATLADDYVADYWKDDRFLGVGAAPIGLMDPRLPDGFRGQLSVTDLAAFDYLGYTIAGSPPAPTLPAAPSNLGAVGTSSSVIRLTWTDNSNNETEFRIEQKVSGSFVDLGPASAKATSIDVEGFPASATATFRVRARNAAGNSGYSNEATGTTFSSGGSSCTPSSTVVCLLSDRFRVSIDYVNSFANPPQPGNFVGAKLVAGVQNPDVATFGISSPQAIEVVVRIQDARPFGINRFDIYYGGLTDLAYNVRVTDTQTGVSRTYSNAAGTVGGGVDRTTFSAALSGDDRLTSGGMDSFVIGVPSFTATSRVPLTKGESKMLLEDVRAALAATANAGAGGACSELEPNQTAADATILTLGQPCSGAANVADVSLGIVFDGDLIEDLYKVTVPSTGTLNVTMTYTTAGADLDLYLFRQVGGSTYEVLDASNGFTQTEAISLQVADGTYYVGVSAFSGGSNYTVTASTSGNPSVCTPSDTVACLLDNRFRVSIDYINAFANPPVPGSFRGAKLVAGSQNPDVATFGISSAQAIEVVVRVQDTRPFGLNRFDVYYGGLTDLEYTVTVTDVQKGTSRTYRNAPGTVGGGVDRSTFTAN